MNDVLVEPLEGFPKRLRERREFAAMKGFCPDCGGSIIASTICDRCGADHDVLVRGIPKFTPEHNELCGRLVSSKGK